MSAAVLTPARPLCDTRPDRGRHRTRPPLGDRVLGAWRAARLEVAIGAASVGAVLAAVLS